MKLDNMNNKEYINKMTDEALNSVDVVKRASPNPYLLTRIHARMNKNNENGWERAGRFISRPAVVIAGLCMIICINVLVIAGNNAAASNNTLADQQATPDEFSNAVATLYDIENNEP